LLASFPMAEDEAGLLARAREGDVDAFADFVRLLERRVRGLLGRLLDDERDVDEAAQDTFVQAWRHLDRYRGDAAPFTWIYRIAVNEALQRTRRKQLDTRSLDAMPGTEPTAEPGTPSPRPVDLEAESRELIGFVAARIRALPFDYRAPLVLRDVEGWTNEEVADALDISIPAAKSRIHRARMQLREELDAWQRGEEGGV
jgi:RNA polymerase sigma-70 factor, ECF subfamily